MFKKKFNLKHLRALVITTLIFLFVGFLFHFFNARAGDKEVEAAWYGTSGWQYRKALVIDASKVSGSSNLTNFPVLVSRTDTDLKDYAQSDGDDILFTSADGQTKLDHEIETYTSSTGQLIAWVEIPTLDYDDDTTIYMYYGNSSASSQQNATGVWNTSYDAVWHLNQIPSGAAGEILDSTSNNLGGTSFGSMSSANSVSARLGNGINFDGSDDRIQMDTTYNPSNTGAVILWMKPDSVNDGNLRRVLGGADSYEIVQDNDSARIMNQLFNNSWLESTLDLSTSSWNHIVATYNFDTNTSKIYINNVEDGTGTSPTDPGTFTLSLGFRTGAASAYYDGILDEVRIMNIVPSDDWIATEYTNQNDPAGFFKTVSTPQAESQVTPDIYYAMDEGYGSALNSTGSNNYTGTISGALWRTEDLCISGKCLYFDGSNDAVTTSGTTSNVRTVSFWVRPITTTEQLVDLNGSAYIESSSGTLSATGFTSPTIYINGQVSSTLVANRWQHVVVTTSTGLSASALRLGQINTNYGQMFLDEVQLYSTALTESQVKSLYNSRSGNLTSVQQGAYDQKSLSDGLVGYWPMDESSENTCDGGVNDFCDISGNGNDLSMPSGSDFNGPGKFGLSLVQSGNNGDDHAIITPFADITTTIRWTVSAWVKTADTDGYIIDTRSSDQNGIGVYTDGANTLKLFVDYNGGSFEKDYEYTIANVDDNNWHHITVARSSDNGIELYFDGVLQTPANITTDTDISSFTDTWSNIVYGSRHSLNAVYQFEGSLDEPRVYNRALTPAEIKQLYNWAPGPVGHWKMDEGSWNNNCSTETVFDSSGNNFNANSCPNSTGITNPATGKFGKAGDFDGVDDYLSYSDTANSALDITGGITLSAWINPHSLPASTSQDRIIDKDLAYNLMVSTNDTGCASGGVGDIVFRAFTASTERICGGTLALNQWSYVTGTYDGSFMRIYLNGVLQTQYAYTGTITTNDNPLYIGNSSTSARHFDGKIDDIKIYNYARTPSQIIQDMNAGHPLVGTPIAAPVGHWSFDEGYGTTANDQTPNNNDLTLNTASWTNNGKFGKAWNGTGTRWLSRADDPDFDFAAGQDFTLSIWMKSDSATNPANYEVLIDKVSYGGTDAGYVLGIDYTNGGIYCEIDDDTTWTPDDGVYSTQDIYDTQWHHIVCIRDTAQGKLQLYIDGKLVDEDTSITATGSLSNDEPLIIGDDNGVNDDLEFTGDIDELKIYRAALSASDVQSEYNQGKTMVLGATGTNSTGAPDNSSSREYCVPGDSSTCNPPVAEWKFDERTGSSAFDTSGNNLTGTLTGNTSFSTGKLGSSILLDGTSDYVSYGDVLDFADGDAFTISLWFMPTGDTQVGHLVSKKLTGSASDIGYSIDWFHTSFGGNTCLYVSDGTAGGSDQYEVCTPDNSTNTLNRWYHLVAVYNNTDLTGSRIYLNGVEYNDYEACNGCTAVTEIGTLANANGLCVGTNPTNSGTCNTDYEFTGKIDDVRIYNYTRTPAQVAWDYNKGKPIAHWQFDETSGTTAYDATGNNNTGTLTNTPTRTTSGKINSAISFDGADDVINAGSASMLDNLTEMTVTAWINPTTYGENNYGRIVDKGTDPTSSSGWSLFTCNDGGTMCTNALAFFINFGAGPTGWWSTANNSISTSRWSHAAVTYNRSSPSNDPIIYINGQPSTLTERNTPSGSASSDAAANLLIGNRNAGDRTYNGLIDDVRIYNYILTPYQIRTAMNDGAATKF